MSLAGLAAVSREAADALLTKNGIRFPEGESLATGDERRQDQSFGLEARTFLADRSSTTISLTHVSN